MLPCAYAIESLLVDVSHRCCLVLMLQGWQHSRPGSTCRCVPAIHLMLSNNLITTQHTLNTCWLQAEDVQAWPGLPEGLRMEALSPQSWLCEAPRRLVVPQRMPGAPRIWTLPRAKLVPGPI